MGSAMLGNFNKCKPKPRWVDTFRILFFQVLVWSGMAGQAWAVASGSGYVNVSCSASSILSGNELTLTLTSKSATNANVAFSNFVRVRGTGPGCTSVQDFAFGGGTTQTKTITMQTAGTCTYSVQKLTGGAETRPAGTKGNSCGVTVTVPPKITYLPGDTTRNYDYARLPTLTVIARAANDSVLSFKGQVTLSASGPGHLVGTDGTNNTITVKASAGRATFPTLSVTRPGDYTFTATIGGSTYRNTLTLKTRQVVNSIAQVQRP